MNEPQAPRRSVSSRPLRLLPLLGTFFLATLTSACAWARQGEDAAGSPAPKPSTATLSSRGELGAFSAPAIETSISVRDGRSGQVLSFDELLDRLAKADVVFLGETHIDETTHHFEDAVLGGLLAKRSGHVVLSMEMFERDVQGVLDDYLAGRIGEEEFRSSARPWANYQSAYRHLIEHAKRARIPVVAANFPAPLRHRIAREGEQAITALTPMERALLPAEFLPNRPQYWRRVDNAVRGHLAMMGGPADPSDARLFDGQSLWDNAMGDACAKALREHPGDMVLHVNGGFHTMFWDGTFHQLRLRTPDAKALTVSIAPSPDPSTERLSGKPAADFVVFAEARASDLDEGFHGVRLGHDLRYRLSVPKSASDAEPVPLLVWLGAAGATPGEGLALWRARLGEECAIAVLEAPYRCLEDDLVQGGRWSWPDTFLEDMAALGRAIEDLRGYLARNYPIDSARTLVAGEGTGGSAAVAAALQAESLPTASFAFAPRHFRHLSDMPLPLAEFAGARGPLARSVHVEVDSQDRAFWQKELAQQAKVGIETALSPPASDPFALGETRARKVRALLGLNPPEPPAADAILVQVSSGSARKARWARIRAARDAHMRVAVIDSPPPSESKALALDIKPAALTDTPPPLCPGAFGGTTVLVLPAQLAAEDLAAFEALEAHDPLAKKSRFHRLRIATSTGEHELSKVLGDLRAANRKNVLVIPVQFCASPNEMRALRARVRAFSDSMTIHWLPGLGGPH